MNAISTSSRSGIITFHRPLEAKGLLLVLLLVLALPAMADGQGGRTQVSGDSVFSDCGDFAIEMTGDLNGCLEIFPERYTCEELDGFALYREWGEEQFRDDDGESSFRTKYDLEAAFTQGFCESFDFSTQLAGGCNHKVFSGEGKFRGSNGLITLLDIIPEPGVSGASNFLYHGAVKISD
jgi:hypothetical protein